VYKIFKNFKTRINQTNTEYLLEYIYSIAEDNKNKTGSWDLL